MSVSRVGTVEIQSGRTSVNNGIITPIVVTISGSNSSDTALVATPSDNIGLYIYEVGHPLYAVQSTVGSSADINYLIVRSE